MIRILSKVEPKLIPFQQVRFARSKPWLPKFRILRQMQAFPQPFDVSAIQDRYRGTPSEMREAFKRDGFLPTKEFMDAPLNINCTESLVEAYTPPKGEGKMSLLFALETTKEKADIRNKGKSFMSERRIKKYVPEYTSKNLAIRAGFIYAKAHELLQNVKENDVQLLELCTEKAFYEMTKNLKLRTFRWRLADVLEPPTVVHTRVASLLSEDNLYAQVTVRHFTKQSLAIYDRFGRLLYGSEDALKDVLEYVVYERRISDEYSDWRMHGKVIPEWHQDQQTYFRTVRVPPTSTEEQPVTSGKHTPVAVVDD